MKKQSILFNLLGVILCGMTAPLAAADCCYPCRNDCCEWSFCDGKIKLGADWLYWKVTEDNLNLGTVQTQSGGATSPSVTNIHSLRQKQCGNYDSGYRVNLGYELPCDCWEVNVAYTYMPANSKGATVNLSGPASVIVPNVVDFPFASIFTESGFVATSLSSKWNLTSNYIDVDIARTVCFGECLKIRPHIGFRAAWFDQNLRVSALSAIPGSPVTDVEAVLKERFKGYGVEGGLWAEYNVGCGLSIVGHFGGSVLYSKFNMNTNATGNLVSPVAANLGTIQACDSFCSATPTVDYFVGFQYADCMCDMLFSAHVGWEQRIWFDVNRIARDGNMGTQGLTLGLEVGF